jgi:aprataxin
MHLQRQQIPPWSHHSIVIVQGKEMRVSQQHALPCMTPAFHQSLMVDYTVTELMKPKPKRQRQPEKNADKNSLRTIFSGRDGLKPYTVDPESYPPSRVVYYNDKFVVINDLFPKATVHLLILPRDPGKNAMRPQEAFDDPQFLADCREEEKRVRGIVASELRRKLGSYSASDKAYLDAMESDDLPDVLPPGRDWDKEVMSGTHTNPSMNHLHIHVLSRDLHSDCLKHGNHYKSFTTNFFIRMEEYPLSEDHPRREYGHFPTDMFCWRCGRNFGNKMARLKEHLEEEFEDWRAE